MSEFKILPPGRHVAVATPGRSVHVSGGDGVISRTPVAGDPSREVIHGAYSEGTYVVTGPRMAPVERKQPAWSRDVEEETDEQAELALQKIRERRP